jgi:hypothetical protein
MDMVLTCNICLFINPFSQKKDKKKLLDSLGQGGGIINPFP